MAIARPPRRAPQDCPGAERFLPQRRELAAMRAAVQACRGCPLYREATQAVFGEGDPAAKQEYDDHRLTEAKKPGGGAHRPSMGQDMVKMELADSNSSALITIPENSTFKYVVMPMRI